MIPNILKHTINKLVRNPSCIVRDWNGKAVDWDNSSWVGFTFPKEPCARREPFSELEVDSSKICVIRNIDWKVNVPVYRSYSIYPYYESSDAVKLSAYIHEVYLNIPLLWCENLFTIGLFINQLDNYSINVFIRQKDYEFLAK